jgi:hypothetical protein
MIHICFRCLTYLFKWYKPLESKFHSIIVKWWPKKFFTLDFGFCPWFMKQNALTTMPSPIHNIWILGPNIDIDDFLFQEFFLMKILFHLVEVDRYFLLWFLFHNIQFHSNFMIHFDQLYQIFKSSRASIKCNHVGLNSTCWTSPCCPLNFNM